MLNVYCNTVQLSEEQEKSLAPSVCTVIVDRDNLVFIDTQQGTPVLTLPVQELLKIHSLLECSEVKVKSDIEVLVKAIEDAYGRLEE